MSRWHFDHRFKLVRSTWAVVPLKDFDNAKQRLSSVLSPAQRRQLFKAMVEDVLAELVDVDILDGVLIVSADFRVMHLAKKYRASLLAEKSGSTMGLNGAIDWAVGVLLERGVENVMVLHGDIPLVRSRDIQRLLLAHFNESSARRQITIVSDRRGQGSNCLICTPPDIVPFAYGEKSYSKHLEAARESEAAVKTMESRSLALDIDEPEDLFALADLMSSDSYYERRETWGVLRDLGFFSCLLESSPQESCHSQAPKESFTQ